ncbi:hypothetical protein E2P81_ATG01121 [Venturia nashicola]|uniref:Uncharacterized protein n=1 Tax=Venturia nashicola TaxID=86259 RepID=A0A4Z1PR94_9PEZI|nr:hypothetical protein E6O75_ATG01148 [Venturia nashicola]TLD38578.1 hypothetical protein E2P81_ATG01121 [Venturia nashicola]
MADIPASQPTVAKATLHNHATPILSLPIEIQNMIWRFSLLHEPEKLYITPGIEIVPPLLRLCTHIRYEAIRIYFSERQFVFPIIDNDRTAVDRFHDAFDRYRLDNVQNISFCLAYSHVNNRTTIAKRKTNFLAWARYYWNHGDPSPMGTDWRTHNYRASKVFAILSELKARGMEWNQAKEIIVNLTDLAGICGEEKLED